MAQSADAETGHESAARLVSRMRARRRDESHRAATGSNWYTR